MGAGGGTMIELLFLPFKIGFFFLKLFLCLFVFGLVLLLLPLLVPLVLILGLVFLVKLVC